MNNRGFVLVMTMALFLLFTMLGLASIHFAGNEKIMAEEEYASTQALWLADAAIEEARSVLAPTLVSRGLTDIGLSGGSNEIICPNPIGGTHCYRWQVLGNGVIDRGGRLFKRKVDTIISYYGVDNAIMSHGDFKNFDPTSESGCLPGSVIVGTVEDGQCELVLENVDFSFESIFGMTLASVLASTPPAQQYANQLNPAPAVPYAGVTIVNIDNGCKITGGACTINIPNDKFNGSGILIINDTRTPKGSVAFDMEGGTFSGIIWTNSALKSAGNPSIVGSIFIDAPPNTPVTDPPTYPTTTITGNGSFSFDSDVVSEAVGYLGGLWAGQVPRIRSWKEVDPG